VYSIKVEQSKRIPMTMTPVNSPSDIAKEEVFAELFNEYESCFTMSKMFGWNFEEKSKDLIEAIEGKAAEVFGFNPLEFSEWVEKQPRETLYGIIPVPHFSGIA